MADPDVLERMQAEWNQRACEDANYYVAFGRREQQDEEFFFSAADVVRSLEYELRRLGKGPWTALEIGCGPGRLMKPLSRHFAEIHGVDVSDEMIRLAEEKLRGVPNAYPHHTAGSDLADFAAESFDFVYSYAVFQHIPSREVVFRYLSEARRVLKNGGILRCQINGLPQTAARYTTWDGVRISAGEVAEFARERDMQLLALEGALTQYMWTTMRKRPAGWVKSLGPAPAGARIRNIGNAHSGEPVVPAAGPMAAASVWIERLPAEADLNHLEVTVDGQPGVLRFLGPPEWDDVSQLNVTLPSPVRTGLAPVEVRWAGERLCPPGWLRVIPASPPVPRITAVTDGVNLLSGTRIVSGSIKAVAEEIAHPERFRATLDGQPVREIEFFCTDPRVPRYEINFKLPEDCRPGVYELRISVGSRRFAAVSIEVV